MRGRHVVNCSQWDVCVLAVLTSALSTGCPLSNCRVRTLPLHAPVQPAQTRGPRITQEPRAPHLCPQASSPPLTLLSLGYRLPVHPQDTTSQCSTPHSATAGRRASPVAQAARELGHGLQPPVPHHPVAVLPRALPEGAVQPRLGQRPRRGVHGQHVQRGKVGPGAGRGDGLMAWKGTHECDTHRQQAQRARF